MNNKILNICILVSIVQNIHATDKQTDLNEINTSIANNINNNVNNSITNLNNINNNINNNKTTYNINTNPNNNIENNIINLNNINTNITDNNKNINDYFNVKRTTSNIWTVTNNNLKCWFMSTWNILAQMCNLSDPKSKIWHTNFAEIIKLLGWNIMDNDRYIDIKDSRSNILMENVNGRPRSKSMNNPSDRTKYALTTNIAAINSKDSKLKDCEFDENNPPFISYINDRVPLTKFNSNNFTIDRTGKINITSDRVDLISTIINYFSNIKWDIPENNQDNNINVNKIINNKINKNIKPNSLINGSIRNKIELSDEINGITDDDKKKRNDALILLSKMQDINCASNDNVNGLLFLLNLFPELQQFIGSAYKKVNSNNSEKKNIKKESNNNKSSKNDIPEDVLIKAANDYIVNDKKLIADKLKLQHEIIKNNKRNIANNKIKIESINNEYKKLHNKLKLLDDNDADRENILKEIQKLKKRQRTRFGSIKYNVQCIKNAYKVIDKINNNKYSNFNNETLNKLYNYDIYLNINKQIDLPTINDINNNQYIISNKEYIVLHCFRNSIEDLVTKYKYINDNKYELIGIYLGNDSHAISFVKTGKKDNTWCGIDTNRNANDDGYRLEDIIYKSSKNNVKNIKKLAPFIKEESLDKSVQKLGVSDLNERGSYYFTNLCSQFQDYKKFQNDTSDNTYLAKVYKHFKYIPEWVLYKKCNKD